MTDKKSLEDLGVEPIAPPSSSKSKRKASSKSKSSGSSKNRVTDLSLTQLQKAVERQFELFGMLLSGYDAYDGQVITEKAPDLADALMELARTHAPVRRFLERMVATGAYSTVIALIGGEIIMPIAVHHQWLPKPVNDAIAEAQDIPLRPKKVTEQRREDKNGEASEESGIGLVRDFDGRESTSQES